MKKLDKSTRVQNFIITTWAYPMVVAPAILAVVLVRYVLNSWLDQFQEYYVRIAISIGTFLVLWVVLALFWLNIGFQLEHIINWYRKLKGKKPIAIVYRELVAKESQERLEKSGELISELKDMSDFDRSMTLLRLLNEERLQRKMLSDKVSHLTIWLVIVIAVLLILRMFS